MHFHTAAVVSTQQSCKKTIELATHPADLAGLREADGGEHHAGRLEGHVDGVRLPHARQHLRSIASLSAGIYPLRVQRPWQDIVYIKGCIV